MADSRQPNPKKVVIADSKLTQTEVKELAESLLDKIMLAKIVKPAREDDKPQELLEGLQKLVPEGYKVSILSTGNNINFKVISPNAQALFVIQVAKCQVASQIASAQLKDEPHLATTYAERYQTAMDSGANKLLNDFDTDVTKRIAIVECIPDTLTGKIRSIHGPGPNKEEKPGPNKEAIILALKTGMEISSMLDNISRKGCFWADMKIANLFWPIRAADIKAIYPDDMITMFYGMTSKHEEPDLTKTQMTPAYLSMHFQTHLPDTPEETRARIEAEYSYQMAVMLYKIATNKDRLNHVEWADSNQNDPAASFDLTHVNFSIIPEGERLKSIIQRLQTYDPEQRLHHSDAARLFNATLLNVSDKEYNAINSEISASRMKALMENLKVGTMRLHAERRGWPATQEREEFIKTYHQTVSVMREHAQNVIKMKNRIEKIDTFELIKLETLESDLKNKQDKLPHEEYTRKLREYGDKRKILEDERANLKKNLATALSTPVVAAPSTSVPAAAASSASAPAAAASSNTQAAAASSTSTEPQTNNTRNIMKQLGHSVRKTPEPTTASSLQSPQQSATAATPANENSQPIPRKKTDPSKELRKTGVIKQRPTTTASTSASQPSATSTANVNTTDSTSTQTPSDGDRKTTFRR